jgi:hypothetical protein
MRSRLRPLVLSVLLLIVGATQPTVTSALQTVQYPCSQWNVMKGFYYQEQTYSLSQIGVVLA